MNQALTHFIAICSDSIGETAEAVVQATLRQFELPNTEIKRYMNVRDEDELTELMEEVARRGGFVAYTLVRPELREVMREEAVRLNIRTVDIMGPMMQAFADTFNDYPKRLPGRSIAWTTAISGGLMRWNSLSNMTMARTLALF